MRECSNCRRAALIVSTLALTLGSVPNHAQAESPRNWPGYRGADGTGTWEGKTILSSSDAIGLEVAWKMKIGSGYSGVAVQDDFVVTMFTAGEDDVVAAFDRETGKEKWRTKLGPKHPGADGAHDGPISTPLIHDGLVFCYTPAGRLSAAELKTGKELWNKDLVKEFDAKVPPYGFASSPIAAGGVVVLEVGGDDKAVMGFDPKTGERRWTAGSDGVMWQSPILSADAGDSQVILAVGRDKIMAVDPSAGKVVWEFAHQGQGAPASSCVPAGKNRLLLHHKEDGSALYNLTGEGAERKGEIAWDNRNIRKTFNVPVYHDGHFYAYSVRFLTCVDAETGESKWRSRAPGDGFIILVDGNLVIITKNGTMHVAKATPDGYEERASTQVFTDVAWDHPAFAGDSVFVRSLDELARVDIKKASAPKLAVDTNPMPEGDARFQAFLERVAKADDKGQVIDEYLAKQKEFPIIEGDRFVHFVYRGEAKDVAVAGDLWGARQERPMERVAGTDLFFYTAELDPDTRLSYQFIKDFEETPDPRNPRKAVISVVGKDMEMSMGGSTIDMSWFAMPQWNAPTYFEVSADATKGRMETVELDSKLLGAKHNIDVYLPAGYDTSKDRYPVAYVHGGSAAKGLGEMDKALDGIIGRSTVPAIVVFINHAPGFSPTDKYSDIFAEEIIPAVDEKFRTIATPAGRAYVGQGFMGFTAIALSLEKPGIVGKVGCQSPFMFGSMAAGLDPLMGKAAESPVDYYIEWSKYDYRNPHENWDLGNAAKEFAAKLEAKGYKVNGGEVHDGTDWPSWRNRYDRLFQALFPKKPNQV
ncbi:MAG: PQQ-binding-like beta-propeller repeat protein [Phycisphaerales bacterium]|nr:PQQ-binding-like beta-propeller repeat protein [Phycisphaerales bacterium]MCB9857140.1 PQQ-binding-like beta-propeller repeat protein [Phycisphaerales bacterium]MCB9861733.1 PQQ-binding-like beta-propeller repeat protein [Phycisphaerales bacterium]